MAKQEKSAAKCTPTQEIKENRALGRKRAQRSLFLARLFAFALILFVLVMVGP